MSLNSTMTNMANKIRNILGIENTMGLSAMVTNLGSIEGCIDNAYTAVESKGGTIPEFKIAGMLHHAISSIPVGSTIQRYPTTGTASVRISGSDTTVSCGFKPDAVFFFGTNPYYGTSVHAGVAFTEANATSMTTIFVGSSSSYLLSSITVTQTSTGFKVKGTRLNTSGVESNESNRNINYVAVKYADSNASGGDNSGGDNNGSDTNIYIVIPNTTQYGESAWSSAAGYVYPTISSSGAVFDIYTEANNYANTHIEIDVSAFSTMKIVGSFTNESTSTSSTLSLSAGLYDSSYNLVKGYSNTNIKNGSSGTINNTYDISGLSGTYAFAIATGLGSASSYHHTTVTINQLEFS